MKVQILVLDLTGVSGSLVGVGVLGVSRSALRLSVRAELSISPREFGPLAQMPHSTERGGDLTT